MCIIIKGLKEDTHPYTENINEKGQISQIRSPGNAKLQLLKYMYELNTRLGANDRNFVGLEDGLRNHPEHITEIK